MKFEKLGKLVKNLDSKRIPLNSLERNQKSDNGKYPYIGANNIVGYINEYIFDEKILCIAEDGGSWGLNETCANIYNEKCWVNNHAHVLIENGNANLEYLRYFFNYENLNKYITGTTRGKLTKTALENIQISIPENLEDQIRIANIFSKVETLIKQRKESIDLLDEYLKSTFLKMFGDPVRNETGWRTDKLGKYIIDLIAGSSYSGVEKNFLADDEIGVIKSSAVTWGRFNPKEYKAVPRKLINKTITNPLKGDLLFSRANTRELVGATCIVLENYFNLFLPDKIWKIVLDEKIVTKHYLHFLLQEPSFKKRLTNTATGSHSSMLNISMDKLRSLICPFPKIELQLQFTQIVEKTEILKAQYQQSLNEFEGLFGSLSQKAFKGELDLSKFKIKIGENLSFEESEILMAAEPEVEYIKSR